MNLENFIKHYDKLNDKLNDKETELNGSYADEYTWLTYRNGKEEINFLDKFTKVFKKYPLGEIIVDYNLGFITDGYSLYVSEGFLNFCLKNKIYGEKAYYFYNHNLDNNMGKERVSYEESLITYKNVTEM